MKTSLNWLNHYLDRPVTADELAALLPNVGFPIDSTEAVVTAAGTHDLKMEVEITSNRSDCLSHVGLARETSAAGGMAVKLPDCSLPAAAAPAVASLTSVEVRDDKLCPLYTARVIKGVKIGPSPRWLADRVEAVGLRTVNNVVDITNFVLFELGQPLHAFDLNRLRGRRIIVRRATTGEGFLAIDGTKHTLRDSQLVIADEQAPVAIAGVMGGRDSEVSDATTDVLLESAQFDPLSVRRTRVALKLSSDSSFRFERGVDPLGVELASRRAARLILELAGGQLAEGVIRVGGPQATPRAITMRVARCNALLGTSLAPQRMVDLLNRLGLFPKLAVVNGAEVITCVVPTYRLDLEREVDLIEEVARLHGLNQIPTRDKIELIVHSPSPVVQARRKVREVLTAHGFHETITFSFVSPRHGQPFLPAGDDDVRVTHDRRKAEPVLRPSVIPSLLECRKTNQDVGNSGVKLFESASCWSRRGGKIVERTMLALVADVDESAGKGVEAAAMALRAMRGTVTELIAQLGGLAGAAEFTPGQSPQFSASAGVSVNGRQVGVIGVLADTTQKLFDLQVPVVVAELEAAAILSLYPPRRKSAALARFPGIERDLSVVVAEETSWATIEGHVRATQPAMLESLDFVGTYRGKPIAQGRKSVTLRMVFRDSAGTLRHDQVDPQVAGVVDRLKQHIGAELRA